MTGMICCLKAGIYVCCCVSSALLAYLLKYNFSLSPQQAAEMWRTVVILVPSKIVVFTAIGEFRGVFSYFRIPDLIRTVMVLLLLNGGCWLVQLISGWRISPSREILLSDLLFSILSILFVRSILRVVNTYFRNVDGIKARPGTLNVAIVGTNHTGSQIAADLKMRRIYGLNPTVFLDDSPKYHGRTIHGIPIAGEPEKLKELCMPLKIQALLIVSQRLLPRRTHELIELGKSLGLKTFIVPSLSDVISGSMQATRLREVDFEDFLERPPLHLHFEKIKVLVRDKVVAVTGAGGSIGSELVRQLAGAHPKELLLIDHSEYNLFRIEQDLLRSGLCGTPILLNITNELALRRCFEKFRPQFVYHTAAYKHVPMLQHQPFVALQNNAFGTGRLALIAAECGTERFVLISTDKAIDPINYMGASKRMAEIFCKAVQRTPNNRTQFMAVRFGNVLGSAGSVLPIFKEQIARGGPLTVTHAEVTRYFMTITEAVGLILEAFAFDDTGDKIFVLDMGTPVKVLDVAKKMIELNNLRVGVDIDIVFTGLRPGEKLHEDLYYNNEEILGKTQHPSIWTLKDLNSVDYTRFLDILHAPLSEDCDVLPLIQKFIPGFQP